MKHWTHLIKTGKCIYKSHHNIYVYENSKYRWLLFNEHFIQSLMNKKNPKKILIPYLDVMLIFPNLYPGKTCLLGLGGGSIVRHLIDKNFSVKVVEILPDMIEVAKHFFHLPSTEQLTIHCTCAQTFLIQTNEQFDHLIVDLGDYSGFPQNLKNKSFIELIFKAMKPGGYCTINLPQFYDIAWFKTLIQEVFSHLPVVIEAQGNWILLIQKQEKKQVLIDILLQKNHLKHLTWHPYYGEIAVLHRPWVQKIKNYLFG